MIDQSVCIYHNGNSRVLQHYRAKFSNLKFNGNWSEAVDRPPTGHLWEICFADVTFDNLLAAKIAGVKIVRHISVYQDDLDYLMPECNKYDYAHWLNHVVCDYLCFADEVISDLQIQSNQTNQTVIITTGRTANAHLQEIYKNNGKSAFECSKTLDQSFLNASEAVLLWREDQWACLTSTWIATCTDYTKSHQISTQPDLEFDQLVAPVDVKWISADWRNSCRIVLDQSLFSKYVCNRATSHITTDYITKNFTSRQKPISYKKHDLIPNFMEIKEWYENSGLVESFNMLYNNVSKHLTPWSILQ